MEKELHDDSGIHVDRHVTTGCPCTELICPDCCMTDACIQCGCDDGEEPTIGNIPIPSNTSSTSRTHSEEKKPWISTPLYSQSLSMTLMHRQISPFQPNADLSVHTKARRQSPSLIHCPSIYQDDDSSSLNRETSRQHQGAGAARLGRTRQQGVGLPPRSQMSGSSSSDMTPSSDAPSRPPRAPPARCLQLPPFWTPKTPESDASS